MPYNLGDIRLFAGTFAPRDWAICDRSLLNTRAHGGQCQLIGTIYGVDGTTNFALSNFTGIAPMAPGSVGVRTIVQGQAMGEPMTSLQATEIPVHSHGLQRKGALKPL